MIKLKVGDKIKVLRGKDKGRSGKIEKIFPKKAVCLVLGINIYKKHLKPSLAADKKGGIYEIPRPIALAKVALICPKCQKKTRVGFKLANKKKVRFCKKCRKEIDVKTD